MLMHSIALLAPRARGARVPGVMLFSNEASVSNSAIYAGLGLTGMVKYFEAMTGGGPSMGRLAPCRTQPPRSCSACMPCFRLW